MILVNPHTDQGFCVTKVFLSFSLCSSAKFDMPPVLTKTLLITVNAHTLVQRMGKELYQHRLRSFSFCLTILFYAACHIKMTYACKLSCHFASLIELDI